MIEEKRKQREQELDDSISLDRTPSTPSCHEKWKGARQRKCGEFTLEVTREVAEKIDVLVEQSKASLFVSEDLHDILGKVIEIEEHLGRVRGLGRCIGFKTFYGRSRSTREVHSKEEIEEIVIAKLVEEMEK
ncbi:unnamed protein product [Lathyrus oleraceus]